MIGLIAGTPYDTHLGKVFLENAGITCLSQNISDNPIDQTKLQNAQSTKLENMVSNEIQSLKEKGCTKILIYCNSLSLCLPITQLSEKLNIEIVTPIQFYYPRLIDLKKVLLITANASSLHLFEKNFLNANESLEIFGMFSTQLLLDIEKGKSSEKVIKSNKLDDLLNYFHSIEQFNIFLCCTHFSKISEGLRLLSSEKQFIYEPTDDILSYLKSA